ncbi:MAG: 4Fe-4S double cluster binding domain-containing protein [Candidatus Aminicenantales bacterium]
MLENRLRDWAAERGYRVAMAGTGVLETVRDKLEKRRDDGLIEAGFFRGNLAGFRYLDDCRVAGPKALVVVAVPRPVAVLPLVFRGRRIDGLIPPTYVNYNKTFDDVLGDLRGGPLGAGSGVTGIEILKAPLKSLAVHLGLVSYGRNNITYAVGLGSGYQLCGYVVGVGESRYGAADREISLSGDCAETAMERCAKCRICLKACPTGAIREDRFLISADHCYTLSSESREPIPGWAKPPASVCLVGCMACQEVCPENKGRLKYVPSGVEFTAEETEAVLEEGLGMRPVANGQPYGGRKEAYASALAKFAGLRLTEDLDVVGRNLRAILIR